MEIEELKKYTNNLHQYNADDIDSFEFMTDKELEEYQRELEFYGGGNLSDYDHLRAVLTFRKNVAFWKQFTEPEECSDCKVFHMEKTCYMCKGKGKRNYGVVAEGIYPNVDTWYKGIDECDMCNGKGETKMTYVYDNRTNKIIFKGTREQCLTYMNNNYEEGSKDFNHVWIEQSHEEKFVSEVKRVVKDYDEALRNLKD